MIIVKDFEQGTPEWFAARAGIPSASCFDKILTSTGKKSTQAKAYQLQLAGERLLGEKAATYQSTDMARGVEMEDEARSTYEFLNDTEVQQVALCYADENKRYSCSPDGLIGEDGGLEIKCPKMHTHVEYMLKGTLPTKYKLQVHGSLMVTGRKWWDFMSYYPGLPPFIVRVQRDEALCERIREAVEAFEAGVSEAESTLRKKFNM